MFVVSDDPKSLSPFREIYDAGLRDVANVWSIYCSSAGRSNKSFSRVTILKMWLSNSYVYTSEFILTLWIIFCGFVKIAAVPSRSYLTFIASRNLACVILGPSVSSGILQSRTLKISWSINKPISIKLDTLFRHLTITSNRKNGLLD